MKVDKKPTVSSENLTRAPSYSLIPLYWESVAPARHLAVLLSTRRMCLRKPGRLPEAAEAFAAAARQAPAWRGYQAMLAALRTNSRRASGRASHNQKTEINPENLNL